MKRLTRRSFLLAGATGLITLGLNPALALASEGKSEDEISALFEEEISRLNQQAKARWEEAVKKAKLEGASIITLDPLDQQISPRTALSITAERNLKVSLWNGALGLYANYEVDSNRITEVYSLNSFAVSSWAFGAQHQASRYTVIDAGRTLAAHYTTLVTWAPEVPLLEHQQMVDSYVEFYPGGGWWVQP